MGMAPYSPNDHLPLGGEEIFEIDDSVSGGQEVIATWVMRKRAESCLGVREIKGGTRRLTRFNRGPPRASRIAPRWPLSLYGRACAGRFRYGLMEYRVHWCDNERDPAQFDGSAGLELCG
jgi:hypothetical protein